jgi:nucleoid DNA-binding protein
LKSEFSINNDKKPMSMSVKDWLIRKLAPKMQISEKTLEAVVNHQFQEANKALTRHKSLEISGWGRFLFNEKKAYRKMVKWEEEKKKLDNLLLNEEVLTSHQKRAYRMRLATLTENLIHLKPKFNNEPFTDLRGMEEQADSSLTFEGIDRDHLEGEDGDMQ